MKRGLSWGAILLLLVLATSTQSQEMSPGKTGDSGGKTVNRLPNNYGKLGLNDEQRQKIYAIQADYRSRIDSLISELEDLRNQEILEIQGTLTSAQQTELMRLLEESRKKRESRKKLN